MHPTILKPNVQDFSCGIGRTARLKNTRVRHPAGRFRSTALPSTTDSIFDPDYTISPRARAMLLRTSMQVKRFF